MNSLGIVGVVSFAIGIVFGSVIVKFFRLQGRRAATLVAITVHYGIRFLSLRF